MNQELLEFGIEANGLVCKFPSSPTFIAVPESTVDFPSLNVLLEEVLVVNATMQQQGTASTLDHADQYCKLKRAPK
ncbi:MAG: hypothetical protein FJW86_01590 [Actinobacteria bacterium]|nr:hypothetical protein [Actinomycetota bacterium]